MNTQQINPKIFENYDFDVLLQKLSQDFDHKLSIVTTSSDAQMAEVTKQFEVVLNEIKMVEGREKDLDKRVKLLQEENVENIKLIEESKIFIKKLEEENKKNTEKLQICENEKNNAIKESKELQLKNNNLFTANLGLNALNRLLTDAKTELENKNNTLQTEKETLIIKINALSETISRSQVHPSCSDEERNSNAPTNFTITIPKPLAKKIVGVACFALLSFGLFRIIVDTK